MQLKEDKIGGILVLKPLDKRFDAHSAVDFKARMADFVSSGHTVIILDLSEVDFIDSSGLGAIVSALKTVGRNGDLVLCGIKETVMSLFRLTRMDRVFRIFTDQGEATAALSS